MSDEVVTGQPKEAVPGGVLNTRSAPVFEVHLDVFSGPFELLLGLIAKHKLDVTEIALAKVTDEFIAHIRAAQDSGGEWDLSQASEFVLVAATLLDLKASRLLPGSTTEDDEDLELIEARDLLFARLLQYRAFKTVSAELAERMETAGRMHPRAAGLEERFASVLPELVMNVTPDQLARTAAQAMIPKPPPTVGVDHLHVVNVSVTEQAAILVDKLRTHRSCDFRELIADADGLPVMVGRFLAVLELYREKQVRLEQDEALADLTVIWSGDESGDVQITDDYDEAAQEVPDGKR